MSARHQSITADFETIDPEKAAKILGLNSHNRNLRNRPVSAYTRDMEAGRWEVNGETIKIAKDGTLLDGQHRLTAVIQSGKTIVSLVVRGLRNVAQDNVDIGAKRKYSDVLALRGETHAVALAAATRLIAQWEGSATKGGIGSGNYMPTNAEMDDTLSKYPWIRDGIPVAARASGNARFSQSVAAFTWWLFQRIDPQDCEFFFERLADGQNLAVGHPIYALRSSLSNIDNVRGAKNSRYLAAIVIKAWNAYRDGETVKLLGFRPGGARPETFPMPK